MTIDEKKIELNLARKQMTMQELAESCSVSRQRMHVILNSKSVTPATVGRVAKALDVDVADIIA